MYYFFGRVILLSGMMLCLYSKAFSQTVTSLRDGLWTDPTVWSGGAVPTPGNATEIIIDHQVVVPAGSSISMVQVSVNGSLTVENGATATLVPDAFPALWDFYIAGVFTMQDGASLNGTSATNTFFDAGSRYVHLQGPLGFIPYATWHINSTFEIAGFRAQGYINIAHSDSWKQIFGNVVYNCTQQTTAFVDLNGYLRDIAGDLTILSTNNQALRLTTTQNSVISIGGDLIIEGPSKLWLSTNATNGTVNVRGNLRYRSSSTGISYFTTKGRMTINVDGELEMNSPGRIHLTSTSTDSVGIREVTLNVARHLTISAGQIIGPPLPGRGTIIFDGSETQNIVTSTTGSSFLGTIDFSVETNATIHLGTSVLSNQAGTLLVRGKLQLGSTHPDGAIQMVNQGNLFIQGSRTFETGATIEYNGVGEQWIGAGHPSSPGVHLICNNPSGVNLTTALDVNNFTVSGIFRSGSFLSVAGNVHVAVGAAWEADFVTLIGDNNQVVRAKGMTFENLVVNKTLNSTVTLQEPLFIRESLEIRSPSTIFNADGYLTLLSTTDEGSGTARVGPLPPGSAIMGDVTVQRYMRGEGRIYRYISSPVSNGTVASLMDDFPVTGTFQNPSTGPGIRSENPSFYYYDESVGGLQAGWTPYPVSGLAGANALIVGKGYAAFIRNGSTSTTWDVTGPLNQGTMDLPVAFTPNNQESNGWNLIGNPYASAIQWDTEGSDRWTLQNISSVISIRDNGIGTGSGTFRYWDMDENYSEIPGGQIAVGQSFWVRATGPSPKLTIREGVKVIGNATFFRTKSTWIPSFALRLSKDSLTDIAYYKIRPSASHGLDSWDGVKLDNGDFDLSFVSPDEKSLAIYATDEMPGEEDIEVRMKDLTPGTYQISLVTKYEFSRYSYLLHDKYLNIDQELKPGTPLTFVVTTDIASAASDRMMLHVSELKLKHDLNVSSPPTTCGDSVVHVTIRGAEPGVRYSVWSEAREITRDTAIAGGDLNVLISTDSLSDGANRLTIEAKTPFQTVMLDTVVMLTKKEKPIVFAGSSRVCMGMPIKLTATSNEEGGTFLWYEDEHSAPVTAGDTLEVTGLKKPADYYVKAVFPFECESDLVKVDLKPVVFDSARIERVGDSVLYTNTQLHHTWYLNGEKISEERMINLTLPGGYKLEVDTAGCVSWDTLEYVVLEVDEGKGEILIYPNPVADKLFVDDRIEGIEIYNSLGVLMMRGENLAGEAANVEALAPGLYYAILRGRSRTWVRGVVVGR